MRSIPAELVPSVSADQMREIDRIMAEDLGIHLMQMMENAGRSMAQFVLHRYMPSTVTVVAGTGGNGGGGMVAARHLANRGVRVRVLTHRSVEDFDDVTARQWSILQAMQIDTYST